MERDLDCRILLPLCYRFGNNQALVKRWWRSRFSSCRENSWNFMPGHHFQLGNRHAWEGVLFFGTFRNLLAGFVWINLPKGTPTQPNSNFGGFCPTQTLSLGFFLFAYSFLFFFDWFVILVSTCYAEYLSPGSVHYWFDCLVKKLIASYVFQYERVSNSAINPGIRKNCNRGLLMWSRWRPDKYGIDLQYIFRHRWPLLQSTYTLQAINSYKSLKMIKSWN